MDIDWIVDRVGEALGEASELRLPVQSVRGSWVGVKRTDGRVRLVVDDLHESSSVDLRDLLHAIHHTVRKDH